jgi:hypothetical protein
MTDQITGYQPRAAFAPTVRIPGRGPKTHELRRLLDRWTKARAHERGMTDEYGKCHEETEAALAARRKLFGDEDEAILDGKTPDPKRMRKLEERVAQAHAAEQTALDHIKGFRERLVAREREADFFAQSNASAIGGELIPGVAKAEARFREVLGQVRAAAQALDDEVFALDASQAVLQAGQRVYSPIGGEVGQLLRLAGKVGGEPLMRLPDDLVELGEQAGMVTDSEWGTIPIAANLPARGGPRSVRAAKDEQARRIDAYPGQ